jgi:hypothetical protein
MYSDDDVDILEVVVVYLVSVFPGQTRGSRFSFYFMCLQFVFCLIKLYQVSLQLSGPVAARLSRTDIWSGLK